MRLRDTLLFRDKNIIVHIDWIVLIRLVNAAKKSHGNCCRHTTAVRDNHKLGTRKDALPEAR